MVWPPRGRGLLLSWELEACLRQARRPHGCPHSGRAQVCPSRAWPQPAGRCRGDALAMPASRLRLLLAPATPAPRPRARWARPALLLPNLALEREERGPEPWNSELEWPSKYPAIPLPWSKKPKPRDGVTFPRSQSCILHLQMSLLLLKCL